MPFDEAGLEGEGTLEEYFTHKPTELPEEFKKIDLIDADFEAEINDRDSAIDRLCLELFADKSGLPRDSVVKVVWPETGYYDEENYRESVRLLRNAKRRKGLWLIGWQMDDPILSLWKDGKPIAAFYASYRGVYQAGGYVVATDAHYSANNFANSDPADNDVWHEYEAGCSDVAMDFVTGRRKFF